MSVRIEYFLLFVVIFATSNVHRAQSKPKKDYCPLKCGKLPHIVCERKNDCSPVSGCKMVPITRRFRTNVLKVHNKLREELAKGSYHGWTAKNMNALTYDLELEYLAACFVNTCPTRNPGICTRSERFPVAGNFHALDHVINEVNTSISSWFDGWKVLWMEDFKGKPVDHLFPLAQIFAISAWAGSRYVGCALAHFGDRQGVFYCAYGPTTLVGRIFDYSENGEDAGKNCMVRNKNFPALCGEVKRVPTEPSWASGSDRSVVECEILLAVIIIKFVWRL